MDLTDLDPKATLAVAGEALRAQRAASAQILQLACHWADQHPGVRVESRENGFHEHPVRLGGEGTPQVMEFCVAELALVLEIHPLGARALVGDALDLRHRLPDLHRMTVEELRLPDWVARRIARKTRHLDPDAARAIDVRIAGDSEDAATLPPSRLLAIVEAMIVDADNASADDDRDDALARRFVSISSHSSRPGTTGVYACVDDAGGQQLEDTISRLARALLEAGDTDPVDVRRAKALVLLATPLLAGRYLLGGVTPESTDAQLAAALQALPLEKLAPTIVLYLHLTDHTLFTRTDGVARWEGVGPITRDHLVDLLGHGNVVVKPVHLPADQRPSDCYEYRGNLREAVLLTTPVDCYPYALARARGLDVDHSDPYDPDDASGSPQTRLGNAGPMIRHHHRIKTHGTMSVRQPRTGTYVWRSPHRHYRMTDRTGTHHVPRVIGDAIHGSSAGEAHFATCML